MACPRLDYPTIIAFGDSITYGSGVSEPEKWVNLLQNNLQQSLGHQPIKVMNAGIGGNTTAEGLARFDKDVLPHLPALVLVEFGGNDNTYDINRHIPVDAFEANLRTIHRLVTTHHGRVIFMSFPPVINDWHASRHVPQGQVPGGTDGCVQRYRDRTRQVAEALGCAFFDLDKVLRDATREHSVERYILPDGVHLTADANLLVATALTSFLTARL